MSLRDVQREVLAQQKLEASERRYRILAETSLDVVVLGSESGILDWVSPSVTALLRYQPEEMIGRHYDEFIKSDDLHIVNEARAKIATKQAATYAVRMVDKLGDEHWVLTSVRESASTNGSSHYRVASGTCCDLHGCIRRSVVNQDDAYRPLVVLLVERGQGFCNRSGLIPRRNHHRDRSGRRCRLQLRLTIQKQ